MAQRRMFSPKITSTDSFLDMPVSARELYFQLGMNADDDGFITPRKMMRMIGASEDDLKVLIAKNFVISFASGVIVISAWKVNNLVRKDWYQETIYTAEKAELETKTNGEYELVNEFVNNSSTEVRLGKVRLGKINTSPAKAGSKPRVKKEKADPFEPMDLAEFMKRCAESKQRHINIIGDYADEKQFDYSTRGQWDALIVQNLRVASSLAPYTDKQLSQAFTRLKSDCRTSQNPKGFITKWGLNTIKKYLE